MPNPYYAQLAAKNPGKYPKRMGMAWGDAECINLIRAVNMKKSIADIAKDHERTVSGISAQLKRIAVDYHDEGYTVKQIRAYTGLSEIQINNAINKAEGVPITKPSKKMDVHLQNSNDDILTILKNIQTMMRTLLDRVQ